VAEPADVAGEELAQVGDAVFEHGQAVEADAEGEALVLFRIKPAVDQHVGVDHAAAQNFEPLTGLADGFGADVCNMYEGSVGVSRKCLQWGP
jgi:hypothetical protein